MDNVSKLVSVIIPCYNTGIYIEETIKSVKSQTYSNIEVIIIDDGSTDNTVEIVQKIKENDPKIKLIKQTNRGQTMARQIGVENSLGEYLLFLDSDDKIHPTYIEKAVSVLDTNQQIGIVTCKAKYFERCDNEWQLGPFDISNFLLENSIFITSLIRRKDFDKVGGFDTELTYAEDWDLFISIIRLGRKVYKISEILFYYRKRMDETSITDNGCKHRDILSDNFLKIYTKHYDFYKENNLSIDIIMSSKNQERKYKMKYYNIWYKKYFYKIFKPRKYKELFN